MLKFLFQLSPMQRFYHNWFQVEKNRFMKIFWITALTSLSILIGSCSKQNEVADAWHWMRTDGGIGYNIHETPSSTGNDINLQLTGDNKYAFYINGVLTSEGTYIIKYQNSIVDHQDKPVIDFSNVADRDMMIEKISNDSLVLSDNCYDGIVSVYTK